MKINKVTMTGADDSIDPKQLVEISKKYPFVEWGILVSRKSQGNNRFPSHDWMNKLNELATKEKLQLSCHLCGDYVKEILMDNHHFILELGNIWEQFKRAQINTHGYKHQFTRGGIAGLKKIDKEIIFQYDGANKTMIELAIFDGVKCSTLFDMSHGAGILPKEWPNPIEGIACGYAGGLSPENITEQIKQIESKVGNYELWIDMETQIRSYDDKQFNLDKVVSVLESCIKTGLVINQ